MTRSKEENLDRIIRLMQTDDSVDAPADSLKWSKDLFRTRAVKPGLIRRITAVLKADLAPGRTVFGERSAPGGARQMFFEAEGRAIDLRIARRREAFEVRGQVLGEDFGHCRVNLGSHTVTADDQGEFMLTGLSEGSYTLTISNGELELVVDAIEVS